MPELTREDVVDVARKAAAQASGPLTRDLFERRTGISQYQIYRLFPHGGWSEVKQLAGLATHPNDNVSKSRLTREEVIEITRKLASTHPEPITRDDFEEITGITPYLVNRLFPEGGWGHLKLLVGLPAHPRDVRSLSDDELLSEYHRVASEAGRLPTVSLFESKSTVAYKTLQARFDGKHGILRRYRQWLEAHDPNSPLLSQLALKSRHEIALAPQAGSTGQADVLTHSRKAREPEFGPPLHFRGLTHAPINEQGVVFLFGIVSHELGFVVEAVQASYPDCEAKRCVDRDNLRWQRVRIEFEYMSRNFKEHGHDPVACDLIVCWEHNWPGCPIEVLELRSVIDQLEA